MGLFETLLGEENCQYLQNKIDNVLIQNVKEIIQGETQLENFIYYVVFFNVEGDDLVIHHLVGYEEYPSQESINHNIEELRNDPDFKKPSKIMDNLKYRIIKVK